MEGAIMFLKRKSAFTLAEVLVTLGIIGVVAAMTMPVLIANTKKSEYSSKLKKVYSSLSQAILLSETLSGGSSLDWSRTGMIKDEDGENDVELNDQENYNFFMTYFAPVLKYTSIEKGGYIETDDGEMFEGTKVYLADGIILTFTNGVCFDIVADLNGNKRPNKEGRDIYRFLLCSRENAKNYFGNENQSFGTYAPVRMSSRDDALQKCKEEPAYCSTLLIRDNWEFKDDYPYRL